MSKSNEEIRAEILRLESELEPNTFVLNSANVGVIARIQELQQECTHRSVEGTFAIKENGACKYCNARI